MDEKSELYTLLDHNQSLLQQYRSLTVMFQTFMIAIAAVFLNYFSTDRGSGASLWFSGIYLALCVLGIFATVGMFQTCNIRALYVDSIQNIVYEVEAGRLALGKNLPIFSILRYVQDRSKKLPRYRRFYDIIDSSRGHHLQLTRGWTRVTLTYLFHGIYAGAWVVFLFDASSTFVSLKVAARAIGGLRFYFGAGA
jgi:hypothetical protein